MTNEALDFDLTTADLASFYEWVSGKDVSNSMRNLVGWQVLNGLIVDGVLLALGVHPNIALPLFFGLVLFGVIVGKLSQRGVSRRYEKFVKDAHPELPQRLTIEFKASGVSERYSDTTEAFRPWPRFSTPTRGPRHLFLWYGPKSAFIVPRRAFASPEQEESFTARFEEMRKAASSSRPQATN